MIRHWIALGSSRPQTLLAICAVLLAVQVSPWWYSSIDSAAYLSMARSLARGTGPTNLGSPLLWYSPGYPALISPLFWISDRPFAAIAILHWALAVGLLLGVYRWSRRVLPEAAVWIAALTVVNHGFWIHFRRPLSEMAFMCLFVGVVNCLAGVGKVSRAGAFVGRLTAAASLTTLLCVIRPVGVMLVPAVAVWTLREVFGGRLSRLRGLGATALISAAAGTPVAMFVLHERTTAAELNGRSYLDDFENAARSPLEGYSRGAQLCVSDIGRVCIPGLFKSHGKPGDWTDVNMLIHVPFFALLCLGWSRWTRRQNDLFAWYVPFYLLLITAHAMDTGARLLLPLLPALFVALWFAAERIAERRQYLIAACLALQLAVGVSYWLGVDLPRARRYDRLWPAVDQLATRIASEPGPVAASRLDGDLQLMLEVALDRSVSMQEDRVKAARWCVTPSGADGPDGFTRVDTHDDLALWSRSLAAGFAAR
ncbi:MAG TPA: hypothetical protein VG826_18545 [Pirellulales bacterium]|nr:hypothetical protein [Pirellulales bacterium]